MRLFYIVVIFRLMMAMTNGCHNAQHEKQSSDFDISGRKRRSLDCENCTSDIDEELTLFFTDCMKNKAPGEFPSWRSVVSFVIRDTYWFQATDKDFCSGRRDSAKCWKRRVQYMLDYSSSLVNLTKECIGDYDRNVKDKNGREFEDYYVTHFDSYEYELSEGEFKRSKRSLPDPMETFVEDEKKKSASATSNVDITEEIAADCPSYDIPLYSSCVASNFETVKLSESSRYPSLLHVDQTSNNEFIQRHYTSCRITTQDIDEKVKYQENCPVVESAMSGDGVQFGHMDIVSVSSCLISDYVAIVKPQSPIFPIFSDCKSRVVKDAMDNATTPTTSPTLTTTTSDATVAIPEFLLPHLYRDFHNKLRIGKCTGGAKWTSYYNNDLPSGSGDMETLAKLHEIYEGQICTDPIAIEARTVNGISSPSTTGDDVFVFSKDGLRCYNHMQNGRNCADYKVRFCCNRKLSECKGNREWTGWLDRDRPKRQEDESLAKHFVEGNACEQPTNIRARIKQNKRPYWRGRNVVRISPTHGLTCKRSDQIKRRSCRNYEVSFCCPIKNSTDSESRNI